MMKPIVFVTGNEGKMAELVEKTKELDIKFIQRNLGYPEIQAETLEDVARYGVEYVKTHLSSPFILEDAGIFIDALQGFPGVYSKYVFYTIGLTGILKLLAHIPTEERTATFRSVYAYGEPALETQLFTGECSGTIITESRGKNGFGYDPIFMPYGSTKTFAEMNSQEKNRFSHRGKAITQLIHYLKKRKKEES